MSKSDVLVEHDVLYMDPRHYVKVRAGILERVGSCDAAHPRLRAGACLATHPSVP